MPFFQPLANFMPRLPGLAGMAGSLQTYAPWPVWRDSTTKEVRFTPLPKKKAVQLWHKAREFERRTRKPGCQDGALGRNGLAVLQTLLFDFLNYASGRLDPSQAAIARKACISARQRDARACQSQIGGRGELVAARGGNPRQTRPLLYGA